MGKDSSYYKDKAKTQKIKLRELIAELPSFASDYIYSKELTAQTSTLISYCYDLLTFFRFLQILVVARLQLHGVCLAFRLRDQSLRVAQTLVNRQGHFHILVVGDVIGSAVDRRVEALRLFRFGIRQPDLLHDLPRVFCRRFLLRRCIHRCGVFDFLHVASTFLVSLSVSWPDRLH